MARRRRRIQASSLGAVALVFATSAAAGGIAVGVLHRVLVGLHATAWSAEQARRSEIAHVPVLARTLGAGSVVEAGDVVLAAFPVDLVDRDALRHPDELVGRVIVDRVLAGEPLREERLAPPGTAAGLGVLVPDGGRAITLDLRDDDRVSDFLEPGDPVDVLATLAADRDHPSETVTLLEAVRVLAVDEELSATARGGVSRRPHVTLAVSPGSAERLAALPPGTPVKLTLRPDVDLAAAVPSPVTTADLLAAPGRRLGVREFRERFSEEEVERWLVLVEGHHARREAVVAAEDLRDPLTGRFAGGP